MREIRIYLPKPQFQVGEKCFLDEEGSNHLLKVLKVKAQTLITLFNGQGLEAQALVLESKKLAEVLIQSVSERHVESNLNLTLGQVISKGDRMEYILQKATELGVSEITPLFSSRCVVKLDDKRLEKKVVSWQKIVINACEQCGRSVVPKVNNPMDLKDYLNCDTDALNLILDPKSQVHLKDLPLPQGKIRLLTGPEGGLSDEEVEIAKSLGFQGINLGPRILRTETAPIVALSILGALFGDL